MSSRHARALLIAAALAIPTIADAQRLPPRGDAVLPSLTRLVPLARPGTAPAAIVEAGPKPFVTLLCKYADFTQVEPGSRAHFERYFTANEYPSVTHYWNEVANGRFTLDGSKVYGWYVLPGNQQDYVGLVGGGVNFGKLEQDCATAADADVNFPDFHGINFVVNTNLDGRLYAGGVSLSKDGVTKNYVSTYLDGVVANVLGLAAHEIGHTFGLPHSSGSYGATYDSCWDVMSLSVCFQVPGTEIRLPLHPNAWQKQRLGVIPPARDAVAGLGTTRFLLERSGRPPDNANPLIITIPVPSPTIGGTYSFYTLETRGGPDAGYDAARPEPAVVIHRFINLGGGLMVWDVDGNGDPNDDGARWTAGEKFVDRQNGIEVSVDSMVGTAFAVTVTMTDRTLADFAPMGRSRTVAAGTLAPRADSASLVLSGTGTDALAWTAYAGGRSRRLTATTLAGTGSAMVRWTEDASVLGVGTYLDTIYVAAPGLANGPALFVDTLIVTASTGLTVGLSATSRNDSLVTGLSSDHELTVRPSGTDAATAAWSASTSAAWIQLFDGDARAGIGTLNWRHNSAGLAPGTYVDTIRVTLAAGAVARFVDTLRVRTPLTISLDRLFGSATVPQASSPVADSIHVTLTGSWASGALLNPDWVFGAGQFLRGLRRPGGGSGWMRIVRTPGSLAPGTYVNRMRVAIAADTAVNVYYEDTLRVVAAPPRIVLSKHSARDTVENGSWQSMDSVRVQPEGEGGPNRRWETRGSTGLAVFQYRNGSVPWGTGNGPGWLVWTRLTSGKSPGIYVDTFVVKFSTGPGDSARFIDTLQVTGVPALAILSDSVRKAGVMGAEYADTLRAEGGEGSWQWTLFAGPLPAGLTLESSGRLAGIAEATGVFHFTAKVTSGTRSLTRQFRVSVTAPVLAQGIVFDKLLAPAGSTSPLSEAELRYLDLQGNRNGRFDIGDARAWLAGQSAASQPAAADGASRAAAQPKVAP